MCVCVCVCCACAGLRLIAIINGSFSRVFPAGTLLVGSGDGKRSYPPAGGGGDAHPDVVLHIQKRKPPQRCVRKCRRVRRSYLGFSPKNPTFPGTFEGKFLEYF